MPPKLPDDISTPALRPYGTSIFTEMTDLAVKHNALNLSQGFPDVDGPEDIRWLAAEAILRGPNQYVHAAGLLEFRQAVAAKMKRFYGVEVDPHTEVTVTSGATEGLCATLLGILSPGDEVILLEPAYDSYAPLVSLAQARVRHVSLHGTGFALPRLELAQAFGLRTKAIIINNPQNPCGKVFSREDLEFIGTLCQDYGAFAIGDEVYEHLTYDGLKHTTLLSIPLLRDRAFVISSTGKTFSMTGWKVGYVVAAPALTRAVRMSHQFITFCGQGPFQEAMAWAMGMPDEYYVNLRESYARKRALLSEGLSACGLEVLRPQGTYYVLADVKTLGYSDDLEFCRALPETAGVAAIPCSVFWNRRRSGRTLVRFCFCKKEEVLAEAVERMKKVGERRREC